jgi:ATP-binding cassette, subfamily C, bacterial LapB
MVQYNQAATALEALNSVMALEVERPQGANFVSRNRLQGDIEFRNVSFTYPEASTAVVANVSLRIRRGERVALIGRVGSGKTTLEKLVLGLYRPAEGAVLVDGIDIRQLDPAELRRNIGYVPQDVTLFFGSLRENLTLAAPDVDDERIVEAARIAGLLDFVNRHPEGFEMQVGERGEGLSGGQRQQVAIARAILHDPAILLLDEPTASMDQGTENDIKRRLGEFSAGRTLVVVTHRTSLLDLVDRVIVLDSGRVVADGPKVEVIEALRQGRVGRSE